MTKYWYSTADINGKRMLTITSYISLEDLKDLVKEHPIGKDIQLFEIEVTEKIKRIEE